MASSATDAPTIAAVGAAVVDNRYVLTTLPKPPGAGLVPIVPWIPDSHPTAEAARAFLASR